MGEVRPDELREAMNRYHADAHVKGAMDEAWAALDAACRAGNLPGDYCSWEGLLKILETVYPESVFPTLADDPKRDPGPRIVSLCRSLSALEADLAEARSEVSGGLAREEDWAKRNAEGRQQLATVTAELAQERDNLNEAGRRANVWVERIAALEAVVDLLRNAPHEDECLTRAFPGKEYDCDCRLSEPGIYEARRALSSLPKNQPEVTDG